MSIKRGYRDKQNLHQVILITKTNNCQFDSQLQTFNINYLKIFYFQIVSSVLILIHFLMEGGGRGGPDFGSLEKYQKLTSQKVSTLCIRTVRRQHFLPLYV